MGGLFPKTEAGRLFVWQPMQLRLLPAYCERRKTERELLAKCL